MNSRKARKTGLKQSKRVAEWRQNDLQQNQQGGSKFFRNLGIIAAATLG